MSMMSGTVVAILIAVFYQGYSVADMGSIFDIADLTCETKNEILDQPVEPWRYDKYAESACSIRRRTWTWWNPG